MAQRALEVFYNDKYAGQSADLIPVAVTRRPRDRYEASLAAIPADAHGAFLEVAAGDGRIAGALLGRFDTITLTEMSEPRVTALREVFAPYDSVQCIHGDIEDDCGALPREAYDVVVLNALIEHLVEPIGVLQALRLSLRPGGCIVLTTPNIAKWTRRTKLLFGRFPGTSSLDEGLLTYDRKPTAMYDEGHLHYFTYRSLERVLLERAGFSSVERFPYGAPPILAQLLPTLFSDCCVRATA